VPAIFTDEVFGCIGAGAASAVLVVAGGLLVGPQAALYGRVLTVAGYAAGCGGVGGVGLVARWRRPAATGVGLTLLAVVAFGPAVQPWYLLWGLVPLGPACTGGIRRVIGFASAGLSPLVGSHWPRSTCDHLAERVR
jgi:hypothetical protein